MQIRRGDTAACLGQRDRLAERSQADTVVNIGHTLQFFILAGVHFQNNFFRFLQPSYVGSDAEGGNQLAVFGNAGHFNDGNVHFTEKARANLLFDMRQMDIHIGGIARIDLITQSGVGLERAAEFDGVCTRQHTVALVRGRRTGNHTDFESLSLGVCGFRFGRYRTRHGFGITRPGKTADADGHTVLNKFGRLLGGNDFLAQTLVAHASCRIAHMILLRIKYLTTRLQLNSPAETPAGRTEYIVKAV